jgi:hypothetical protein
MDPERIRAYLQVACAGLGFDIGEVWWTSNENGSSTVAAIRKSLLVRAVSIAFSSHGHLPSLGSEVSRVPFILGVIALSQLASICHPVLEERLGVTMHIRFSLPVSVVFCRDRRSTR